MSNEYKVVNGTSYDPRTPDEVIAVLENARQNNQRLHISLGYTDEKDIGLDWLEEFMSYGYIGRSTGKVKIPLLIHNSRSTSGPALLDHCIVRIRTSAGGRVLWSHPNYHHGKMTIHTKPIPVEYLPKDVLQVEIRRDNKTHARFRDMPAARRWIHKLGVKAEIVA